MTLTEFLLARIAEDERAVEPHRGYMDWVPLGAIESGDGYAECSISAPRVLAECEAKRRIIGEHTYPPGEFTALITTCPRCVDHNDGQGTRGHDLSIPCPTLRMLALPYADHPDYRQEWRP